MALHNNIADERSFMFGPGAREGVSPGVLVYCIYFIQNTVKAVILWNIFTI